MSPALPRITAKKLIPIIERLGCVFLRQKGSHRIYRGLTNKRFAVPCHAGNILLPKTLKSILRSIPLSVEELVDLL